MTDDTEPRGQTRRGLLGGLGLAGAASVMGGAQLASFSLGSTAAFAQAGGKPLSVAVGRTNLSDKANADKWVNITALRRIGQPEGVAGPAVFLAYDASAFVTGQSLNVCGGIVLS